VETIEVPGFGTVTVRRWRLEDRDAILERANNRKIWLNLRDLFPHPYTIEDADRFLGMATRRETYFAIEAGGEAAGSIGFSPGVDVHRFTAEVGYWLGEDHWGRGIMTAVLTRMSGIMLGSLGYHRIFATPFAWNTASAKVLEKSGFELEGRARRSAFKDGKVVDQLVYAKVAAPSGPRG